MRYAGTNTSQPYVSKVLLENLPDGRLKAIVQVATPSNPMSSELESAMHTTIVKVCDSTIIKKLSRNNKNANIELIDNARKEGKFGNLDLSVAEVKFVPRVTKEVEKGYRIANIEFVLNNVIDLTFYVVCQYNLGHPRFAEIASSEHFKRKLYNDASIAAEDVYRSGRLVDKSNAFVHTDGATVQKRQRDYSVVRGSQRIWTGPVHRYTKSSPRSDGYVGYATHGPDPVQPKLKLVQFPNATVHDYRILEKISNVPFNCKIEENQPLVHKKNAYFSNLCITTDETGYVKMFFAVNVGEIIKNNVKLPRFVSSATSADVALDPMKSSFEDVINLSLFKNISITRTAVDHNGNILSGGTEKFIEKIVESSQEGSRLSNATSTTMSLKNGDMNRIQESTLGSIREIDNLFTEQDNPHIRFFTATDMSMTEKTHGAYKYSLNLDIKDGSITYLQEIYDSLKKGLNSFQAYHHSFVTNNKLDKTHFINDEGPWTWGLSNLIRTIAAFQEELLGEEKIEEKLYILASPNTCTAESLSKVMKVYEKVTSKMTHIIKELPTKSKRDAENMKPNSVISGARKFPSLINIQHTFSDLYTPDGGSEAGYHYLPRSRTSTAGLQTIKSEDFMSRTSQERLKLFGSQPISSQISYLTPSFLKIQNSVFNTFDSAYVELANFNALINLYNYKKYGTIILGDKKESIENTQGKTSDCVQDSLYAKQLNSFSQHVKNNLSNLMSDINVVGAKKYDSPCFEKTEQQEKEYAKLMMPNATSTKYKEEISSGGVKADLSHANPVNLSSIFVPLFYMKYLNIYKELCCFVEKLNKTSDVGLPNQLQALKLANKNMTTHQWYDDNNQSSLKKLSNVAFHYLNNKNLVNIEVLTGFEGGHAKAPLWARLKEAHIKEAAASRKTNLLCRMRPYTNEDLCFSRNDFLDLNIFNQCFLLDASKHPVSERPRKINRKFQPMTRIRALDKNDFLKLESAQMKTNLLFGQVIKQKKRKKKTSTTTTQSTTSTQTSTTMSTVATSTMGTTGGTTSGGSY